jgi:hypothetical protein
VLGWSGIGFGAAALGAGAILSASSLAVSHGPQAEDMSANSRIKELNAGAAVAYIAGGASVATGLFLLLWPGGSRVQVVATPAGGYVGYSQSF